MRPSPDWGNGLKGVSGLKAGHSKVIYFLTDSLSSVRDVVNGSGTVVASYEFDAWGAKISPANTGGVESQKTFVGGMSVQDEVADTGLMMMGHRFYAPDLGRFLNRDPIGFAGGMNLFEYSSSSPIKFVDYSGLQTGEGGSDWGTFDGTLGGANWNADLGQLTSTDHFATPSDRDSLFVGILKGQVESVQFFGQFSNGILGTASEAIDVTTAATSANSPGDFLGLISRLGWRFGKHSELNKYNCNDSHHIVQDAAVRELKGYSRGEAPTIQLPGPSTRIGSPHYAATLVQRQKGGGTLRAEFRIGYKAIRRAGLTEEEARHQLSRAAEYFFDQLGYNPDTPTRKVGNRRK